jgi:hypothetical protein
VPDSRPPEGRPEERPEPEWKRRKRLAELFGDVLPDTTSDERDERDDEDAADEWLRRQVPPHHGGR